MSCNCVVENLDEQVSLLIGLHLSLRVQRSLSRCMCLADQPSDGQEPQPDDRAAKDLIAGGIVVELKKDEN